MKEVQIISNMQKHSIWGKHYFSCRPFKVKTPQLQLDFCIIDWTERRWSKITLVASFLFYTTRNFAPNAISNFCGMNIDFLFN